MTAENTDQQFRIEHDTMGEVKVPVNALYRAQTQRAVENFPISGKGLEPAHIHALAQVKKAAAKANAELGIISQERADAIVAAADQVIAGDHDDHARRGQGLTEDRRQRGRDGGSRVARHHDRRDGVARRPPGVLGRGQGRALVVHGPLDDGGSRVGGRTRTDAHCHVRYYVPPGAAREATSLRSPTWRRPRLDP